MKIINQVFKFNISEIKQNIFNEFFSTNIGRFLVLNIVRKEGNFYFLNFNGREIKAEISFDIPENSYIIFKVLNLKDGLLYLKIIDVILKSDQEDGIINVINLKFEDEIKNLFELYKEILQRYYPFVNGWQIYYNINDYMYNIFIYNYKEHDGKVLDSNRLLIKVQTKNMGEISALIKNIGKSFYIDLYGNRFAVELLNKYRGILDEIMKFYGLELRKVTFNVTKKVNDFKFLDIKV